MMVNQTILKLVKSIHFLLAVGFGNKTFSYWPYFLRGLITQSISNVTQSISNVTQLISNVTQSISNVTQSISNVTQSISNVTQLISNVIP